MKTDAQILRDRVANNATADEAPLVAILNDLPDASLSRLHQILTDNAEIKRNRNEASSSVAFARATMQFEPSMEPIFSFEDWRRKVVSSGFHRYVIAFLTSASKHIDNENKHGWKFVSNSLNSDPLQELNLDLLSGAIGDTNASEFLKFIKTLNSVTDLIPSILTGDAELLPKDYQYSLALADLLALELWERNKEITKTGYYINERKRVLTPERKQWIKEADNVLKFVIDNFFPLKPEVFVEFATISIAYLKLPYDNVRMQYFEDFAVKGRELVFC